MNAVSRLSLTWFIASSSLSLCQLAGLSTPLRSSFSLSISVFASTLASVPNAYIDCLVLSRFLSYLLTICLYVDVSRLVSFRFFSIHFDSRRLIAGGVPIRFSASLSFWRQVFRLTN